MREFFKYLASLLSATFCIMFFLDNVYSYVYKNSPPRSKIQNILQHKDQKYDLAFFGSSRTEAHIDCALIKKMTGKSCVNFGISGGSIADMLLIMKLAKEKNLSFSKSFMQVDYNYNKEGITPNFKAGLVPYHNHPIVRKQLRNDIKNYPFLYIPFYGYMTSGRVTEFREFCNLLLKRSPNFNLEIGFTPYTGMGLRTVGKFPDSPIEKNDMLEQMKEVSSRTQLDLILFTTPYCPHVENRNYVELLEAKLPNLKNYISIFDEKPELYYDCGHLNEQGAKEFSRFLAREIIKENLIP